MVDRVAGLAVDGEGYDAALSGLGDHREVGDHQEGVGALVLIHGLDEVDTFGGDLDRDGLLTPAAFGFDVLTPGSYELLLVQDGQRGELGDIGDGLAIVRMAADAPGADLLPGVFIELIADHEPHLGVPGGFETMELLDESEFAGGARGFAAELVGVGELLEELEGIVDFVDAEIEIGDVNGGDLDLGLCAGGVGLGAGEREEGLLLIGLGRDEEG